jgi:hypothetical protein
MRYDINENCNILCNEAIGIINSYILNAEV